MMNWINNILPDLYNLIIYPILGIGGVLLIVLMSTKINEIKQKTKNETAKKYLDMLDSTITDTVLATTQTYVEALKKQGKFDAEAQKIAFQKTYDAVMKVLTDEAKKYITEAVGDLDTYVNNKIESQVKIQKNK